MSTSYSNILISKLNNHLVLNQLDQTFNDMVSEQLSTIATYKDAFCQQSELDSIYSNLNRYNLPIESVRHIINEGCNFDNIFKSLRFLDDSQLKYERLGVSIAISEQIDQIKSFMNCKIGLIRLLDQNVPDFDYFASKFDSINNFKLSDQFKLELESEFRDIISIIDNMEFSEAIKIQEFFNILFSIESENIILIINPNSIHLKMNLNNKSYMSYCSEIYNETQQTTIENNFIDLYHVKSVKQQIKKLFDRKICRLSQLEIRDFIIDNSPYDTYLISIDEVLEQIIHGNISLRNIWIKNSQIYTEIFNKLKLMQNKIIFDGIHFVQNKFDEVNENLMKFQSCISNCNVKFLMIKEKISLSSQILLNCLRNKNLHQLVLKGNLTPFDIDSFEKYLNKSNLECLILNQIWNNADLIKIYNILLKNFKITKFALNSLKFHEEIPINMNLQNDINEIHKIILFNIKLKKLSIYQLNDTIYDQLYNINKVKCRTQFLRQNEMLLTIIRNYKMKNVRFELFESQIMKYSNFKMLTKIVNCQDSLFNAYKIQKLIKTDE